MSTWGKNIEFSLFGESHGTGIGGVLSGLKAGVKINLESVQLQMDRRKPGRGNGASPRKELDIPEVLSGLSRGEDGMLRTNGSPLAFLIRNNDQHSSDYLALKNTPRPGHADYPATVKYEGFADLRGGGHFSGRITAPLVFAGAICRQILAERGIVIGAHVRKIANEEDFPFSLGNLFPAFLSRLASVYFPTVSPKAKKAMINAIAAAEKAGDSVGGVVECACLGLPVGLGGAGFFRGLESVIADLVFSIPACKGVEFGEGFALAGMMGSQSNDEMFFEGGKIETHSNNAGGILGGMSNGMPLVFRAAFKPTPSIAMEQNTVNLPDKLNTHISIAGRHDACIVPRAVPVVEAAAAMAILDSWDLD